MYSLEVDKKRVGYCRDYARKILKRYSVENPPVSIHEIAKSEGFIIKLLDQPKEFSGILHRETKSIGVNQNHHMYRQRFSIAHEMGHYYLEHPEVRKLNYLDNGDELKKIYDAEADEFAGEILVPREMLKKKVKQHKTVGELATRFFVSTTVMSIQIMKHGLLNQLVPK